MDDLDDEEANKDLESPSVKIKEGKENLVDPIS